LRNGKQKKRLLLLSHDLPMGQKERRGNVSKGQGSKEERAQGIKR